ncbi:MAG TPA: hypothetical protein VJZ76_03530 [Thermoanaerobaculia bacterium]|nr:hypothetical protein [Thermoanaerobaculia bacterium]
MRRTVAILTAAVIVLSTACGNPTFPCGTFLFQGTGHTNGGVNVFVHFDFDPATCGATCTCNSVVYIQIVRVIDRDTGDFLAPGPEQKNRIVTGDTDATQNGWAVDRIDGRTWGYYGRNNDGTFALVVPGSNTTDARLEDGPRGWDEGTWFDAVSVPVCIDTAAACNNALLGYQYWLFIAAATGTPTGDPFNEVGVTWMQDAFDKAVIEWNNDAPGLGKHSLPAMTRL